MPSVGHFSPEDVKEFWVFAARLGSSTPHSADSGSALFEITEQNADSATFNRYARNRELQNLQNWLLLVL